MEYLKEKEVEPVVNDKKYKIKFTQKIDLNNKDKDVDEIDICVRIMKVDEEKSCVEFTKTEGNNAQFHEIYKDLMANVLNFSI